VKHDDKDEKLAARFGVGGNTATMASRDVLAGARVSLVYHDPDDGWWFSSENDDDDKDPGVGCLACVLHADPELVEVADLPLNWIAERTNDGAWARQSRPDDWGPWEEEDDAIPEMTEDGFVKIRARVPESPSAPLVEGMWGRPLGDDLYRLENAPWFARGLNWGDVIRCAPDPDEGDLLFTVEVVERSGCSSFQLTIGSKAAPEDRLEILRGLEERGAQFEWMENESGDRVYAATVPPDRDAAAVAQYLAHAALKFEFLTWLKNSD
jgi:hypothetical protein